MFLAAFPLLIVLEGLKLSHIPNWWCNHKSLFRGCDYSISNEVYTYLLYGPGKKQVRFGKVSSYLKKPIRTKKRYSRQKAIELFNGCANNDLTLDRDPTCAEVLAYIFSWVGVLVGLPCYVITVCFSLAYPIIRFSTVPWDDQTLLQQLFSVAYLTVLGLWLTLCPHAYRFNQVHANINGVPTGQDKTFHMFLKDLHAALASGSSILGDANKTTSAGDVDVSIDDQKENGKEKKDQVSHVGSSALEMKGLQEEPTVASELEDQDKGKEKLSSQDVAGESMLTDPIIATTTYVLSTQTQAESEEKTTVVSNNNDDIIISADKTSSPPQPVVMTDDSVVETTGTDPESKSQDTVLSVTGTTGTLPSGAEKRPSLQKMTSAYRKHAALEARRIAGPQGARAMNVLNAHPILPVLIRALSQPEADPNEMDLPPLQRTASLGSLIKQLDIISDRPKPEDLVRSLTN